MMTTEAPAIEATPVTPTEATTPTTDIAQRFNQFREGGSPAPVAAPAPALEPTPKPEPAPAPKPDAKPATGTPLDDATVEPDSKSFNLPLDDDSDEPEPTADTEELPSNIKDGTPQAVAFRALRKEKQEIARQRDTFQTELEQFKSKATELEGERTIREELEAKVKEYEAKLAITRIEESPVYQKAVTEPYVKIADATAKFAEQYGVDLRELDKVFDIADDSKRKEGFKNLLSGLDIDPEDQLEIRTLAKEFRTIAAKRDDILADSEKTLTELEAIQTKQTERDAAIRAEERRATTKQLADHITRKLPVLKTLAGFDYDAVVAKVTDTDPATIDLANQAYNAIAGQALPKMTKAYQEALRQIEQLSDDMEKIRNSSPRPDSSMPVSPEKPSSVTQGGTIADRFRSTFGG